MIDQILSQDDSYDVVVINPMSNYIVEDLNSSMAANSFYNELNRIQLKYKVGTIVVAHNNKKGTMAGNQGFANKFRSRIILERIGSSNIFNLIVAKGHKKAGFLQKVIKHNDEDEWLYWMETTPADVDTWTTGELTNGQKQLMDFLDPSAHITRQELADKLQWHVNAVSKAVNAINNKQRPKGVTVRYDEANEYDIIIIHKGDSKTSPISYTLRPKT